MRVSYGNKDQLLQTLLFCVALFFFNNCHATSIQFGVNVPIFMQAKDPEGVHGYRAVIWYQPQSLIWKQSQLYFAAGAGHWWVHGTDIHHSLNIVAIAPVIRYYLVKKPTFSPYVEASIGASYLSRTKLGNSNLGMHYAFQDEVGIGIAFGKEQNFFTSLSALHYSNGSLAAMNAGITIPVIFNIGYHF